MGWRSRTPWLIAPSTSGLVGKRDLSMEMVKMLLLMEKLNLMQLEWRFAIEFRSLAVPLVGTRTPVLPQAAG